MLGVRNYKIIKIGTWNVRIISGKKVELAQLNQIRKKGV